MNEQLKEHIKRKVWHKGYGLVSDGAVKLIAELIVEECIAAHVDDYGVDIIGDVLKKHLGVE